MQKCDPNVFRKSSNTISEDERILNNVNGNSQALKKERSSNLELYRIIVMMLIVMHHYVVNSGVIQEVNNDPLASNSIFMTLFGLWGKTGINCFVMITGWFMCSSQIRMVKFLKLLLQIELYKILFDLVFILSGYTDFTVYTIRHLLPVTGVSDGFGSCFILFFLMIPFLNILIQNLTKRQHAWLVILLLGIYTLMGSSVIIRVTFNYVTWFSVLYVLMSYIRFYGIPLRVTNHQWGWLTLLMILLSIASVFLITMVGLKLDKQLPSWFFVTDSNKILALLTAFCSFMWFKELKIPQSKFINMVAASTFGVLLIHANSDTMRQWLWRDTLQNVRFFYSEYYLLHAVLSCFVIFVVCIIIDRLRIRFAETPMIRWAETKWKDTFSQIDLKYFSSIQK